MSVVLRVGHAAVFQMQASSVLLRQMPEMALEDSQGTLPEAYEWRQVSELIDFIQQSDQPCQRYCKRSNSVISQINSTIWNFNTFY